MNIQDLQELRVWAIEQTKGAYGTDDVSYWVRAAEELVEYVRRGSIQSVDLYYRASQPQPPNCKTPTPDESTTLGIARGEKG